MCIIFTIIIHKNIYLIDLYNLFKNVNELIGVFPPINMGISSPN